MKKKAWSILLVFSLVLSTVFWGIDLNSNTVHAEDTKQQTVTVKYEVLEERLAARGAIVAINKAREAIKEKMPSLPFLQTLELQDLTEDSKLSTIAVERAKEVVLYNSREKRPDGSAPNSAFEPYKTLISDSDHEELILAGVDPTKLTADSILNEANKDLLALANPAYTHVGIGVVSYEAEQYCVIELSKVKIGDETASGHNGKVNVSMTIVKDYINYRVLNIEKTDISLYNGDSYDLSKIKVTGAIATDDDFHSAEKTVVLQEIGSVSWSTTADTDSSVATVSGNKVTVHKANQGEKITLEAEALVAGEKTKGTLEATCQGPKIAVTGIKLDRPSLRMQPRETANLAVTITPSNASDKSVNWSSSNSRVATVDQAGSIIAVSQGTTVITAKTNDGGYTATCQVTVSKDGKTHVDSVTIEPSEITLFEGGESVQLTATVFPSNAEPEYRKIKWETNDKSVAVVNDLGLVSPVAYGTTHITAYAENGSVKATCIVSVLRGQRVPATSLVLDQTTVTMALGATTQLTATVAPATTTDKLTWATTNPDIVTITPSEDGRSATITAHETTGQAQIRVQSTGGLSTSCTVIVKTQEELQTENANVLAIQASRISIKKLTAGKKKMTVTLTKKSLSGVKVTYQIRYRIGSGKWKKVNSSGTKKTIKKLKKGKKYTVSARACATINGVKYYGKWSKSKKVKIKK